METTKRRPVRGIIWGVILGLGLALISIGQGWAALGTWPPVLILLAGIVVGFLWSTFGPAKSTRQPTGGSGSTGPDESAGAAPEPA